MIADPSFQILLSAVFVLTTAYSLFWVVRSGHWRDRVSYFTHTLMGAAMFAMVWPWGMDERLLVSQIVLFSLAAFWFVYLIVTHHAVSQRESLTDGHHDSKTKLAYHAVMMTAMSIMAITMIIPTSGSSDSAEHEMGSMPGMEMPGDSGAPGDAQIWINVIAIAFAIGFAVAALYFLGSAIASLTAADRGTRTARFRSADAIWNLLMAVGMSALFLPLISFGEVASHH